MGRWRDVTGAARGWWRDTKGKGAKGSGKVERREGKSGVIDAKGSGADGKGQGKRGWSGRKGMREEAGWRSHGLRAERRWRGEGESVLAARMLAPLGSS